MSEVRDMTYRDIDAMAQVLIEEHQERQRQEQIAARKRGRQR